MAWTAATKLNPSLPISVQTIHIDLVPVTAVAGELDMTTDGVVWDEIRAQLETEPDVLVLDLTEVGFMGSAGSDPRAHDRGHGAGSRSAHRCPQRGRRGLTATGTGKG